MAPYYERPVTPRQGTKVQRSQRTCQERRRESPKKKTADLDPDGNKGICGWKSLEGTYLGGGGGGGGAKLYARRRSRLCAGNQASLSRQRCHSLRGEKGKKKSRRRKKEESERRKSHSRRPQKPVTRATRDFTTRAGDQEAAGATSS